MEKPLDGNEWIKALLPPNAELVELEGPHRHFLVVADFDGDGAEEYAAAYRLDNQLFVFLLKHNGHAWNISGYAEGHGDSIAGLYAAPVNRLDRMSLVVDYRVVSAGVEKLRRSIYDWPSEAVQQHNPASYRHTLRQVNLYPAVNRTADGTFWGYITAQGQWGIAPEFESAEDFQPIGLAIVNKNGHSGLINSSGQVIVPAKYDTILPFSDGLAIVITDQGFQVINQLGALITRRSYSYISPYQEGRALFSVVDAAGQSSYGYLDAQGDEVIPARFLQGSDFQNGKALVQIAEKQFALIGRGGERLVAYPYPFVGPLGDGRLAFQKDVNGKYGYLDEQGTVVIPPMFTGAQPFQEGRAVVNTAADYQNRYGLIDRRGSFVVKPEYNDIRQLGEGRIALGKAIDVQEPYRGSRYALADNNGKPLTDFWFDDVADYKRGLASVTTGKETFFVDKNGRRASGLPVVSGSGTLTLVGALIKAFVDNRLSYYGPAGRLVWEQNRVIPLAPPYRVLEAKYKPNKDYLVYYPQVEGMANQASEKQVNQRLADLSEVKRVDPAVQLEYSYTGDFAVTFFRKNLLVLELNGYKFPFGAAHGMPSREHAKLDLVSGQFYELKDLFKPGSSYVLVLSEIVGQQIKTDPQYSYVWPDEYKGIKPEQPFYVTGDSLYLYFTPYEIAPYVAGFPTFRIPFGQIRQIIDEKAPFWRSFH
ncbi:MAG: WG repeat-containing protein [Gorillibacterium sp.]|nr:WG repeat-containing protein [Gorillibacterium sp.]